VTGRDVEVRANRMLREYLIECRGGVRGARTYVSPVGDAATFDETLCLVEDLGCNLHAFVRACSADPPRADLVAQAHGILSTFLLERNNFYSQLRFRDVYCIFEVIGMKKSTFLSKVSKTDLYPAFLKEGFGCEEATWVDEYKLKQLFAEGKMTGSCIYLAEDTRVGLEVVVKWPALQREIDVLKALSSRFSNFSGLPQLLGSGLYKGRPYFVSPVLGTSLQQHFEWLEYHAMRQRWAAVRVLGRMALRRLEAVHDCGYVHCDISGHNFLLGPVGGSGSNRQHCRPPATLHLMDFGCARSFPGAGPVPGDEGSMEFLSIRSANGGERTPADDIEALGWMLYGGMCGSMPWFRWLNEYYALKNSLKEFKRGPLLLRVADAKLKLLNEGA